MACDHHYYHPGAISTSQRGPFHITFLYLQKCEKLVNKISCNNGEGLMRSK